MLCGHPIISAFVQIFQDEFICIFYNISAQTDVISVENLQNNRLTFDLARGIMVSE